MLLALEPLVAAGTTQQPQSTANFISLQRDMWMFIYVYMNSHMNTHMWICKHKNKSIPATFYADHNRPRGRARVNTHHHPFYFPLLFHCNQRTQGALTEPRGHFQSSGLLQRIGPKETAQSLQRIALWTTSTHLLGYRTHLDFLSWTDWSLTNCLDSAAGLLQAAGI